MLEVVFGTKALVRGFRAAVEGMREEVEERKASGVTSYCTARLRERQRAIPGAKTEICRLSTN